MHRNVYSYITQSGVMPHISATGTTANAFGAACGTNTALPEHSNPKMFSNSNTYLATNSRYGPAANVNMLYPQGSSLATEQTQTSANPNDMSWSGTQNPAQIPGVYTSSSTFHQHQSMPHETTQELIAGGYSDGENGSAGPMTPGTFGDTNSDSRTLTLHWKRDNGTHAQAQVQATDPVYDPMTMMWPLHLQLMRCGEGIRNDNIQSWLHNNQAPLTRIKYVPGENNCDFDELVESLRNRGSIATAGWDVGGKHQVRLLFAPLCMDLLCAAFPMGIPELPTRHSRGLVRKGRHVIKSSKRSSRPAPVPDSVAKPSSPEQPYHDAMDGTQNPQPQRWTQPQADYPPPETMEPPQGDPTLLVPYSQVTTVTPVRAASPPPPHLQLWPQAYTQGPLEPSQTQQSLEVTSQNMVIADSELDGWRTDTDTPIFVPDSPMPTNSTSPIRGADVWFGVGENDTNYSHADDIFGGGNPIGSYTSLNLGGEDGAMKGVVMEGISPTADSGVWRCSDGYMFWDG